jgi:hypothetical protein
LAIESIDKLTNTKRKFIKHDYGIDYSPVNFRHAQDLHQLSSSDGSRALTQAFVHYRKHLTDARCRWRHKISGGIHVGNESDLVATGQFCEWECICNFTDKTPLPRDSVMMTLLEQFQESKSHRRWFKGFNGSEFISPVEILYCLNSLVRSAISFMYSHSWGDGLDSRSSSDSGEYTFHRPFTIANVSEGAKLIEQRGMQLRGFNEPLIVNDPVWLEDFANPFITAASTTPNLELTEAEVEGLVQLLTSENLSDDNPFMIPENK